MSTLADDKSQDQYAKAFCVAGAKDGKTTKLVADCLGALPGQTHGVVTSPAHLHVFPFDTAATEGLAPFLTELCGKPKSILEVDVIDIKDAIEKANACRTDWNIGFFNGIIQKVNELKARMVKTQGVHAVIVSGLTGVSEVFKRAISGGVSVEGRKGSGMDMSKWDTYSQCLLDLRAALQSDTHHVFWEGHVIKQIEKGQGNEETMTEVIPVQGPVAKNWSFNVAQNFRLRRTTEKYQGTKIDKMYYETRPTAEFSASGRGFTTALDPRELDMAVILKKLGKRVGGMTL
jgi:hypothetical protein